MISYNFPISVFWGSPAPASSNEAPMPVAVKLLSSEVHTAQVSAIRLGASLASSRVVCLFAHPQGPKEQPHGGAIFLQALKGGSISVIGKYRFANHAVTEVAAVALRPNSFVVAYRSHI